MSDDDESVQFMAVEESECESVQFREVGGMDTEDDESVQFNEVESDSVNNPSFRNPPGQWFFNRSRSASQRSQSGASQNTPATVLTNSEEFGERHQSPNADRHESPVKSPQSVIATKIPATSAEAAGEAHGAPTQSPEKTPSTLAPNQQVSGGSVANNGNDKEEPPKEAAPKQPKKTVVGKHLQATGTAANRSHSAGSGRAVKKYQPVIPGVGPAPNNKAPTPTAGKAQPLASTPSGTVEKHIHHRRVSSLNHPPTLLSTGSFQDLPAEEEEKSRSTSSITDATGAPNGVAHTTAPCSEVGPHAMESVSLPGRRTATTIWVPQTGSENPEVSAIEQAEADSTAVPAELAQARKEHDRIKKQKAQYQQELEGLDQRVVAAKKANRQSESQTLLKAGIIPLRETNKRYATAKSVSIPVLAVPSSPPVSIGSPRKEAGVGAEAAAQGGLIGGVVPVGTAQPKGQFAKKGSKSGSNVVRRGKNEQIGAQRAVEAANRSPARGGAMTSSGLHASSSFDDVLFLIAKETAVLVPDSFPGSPASSCASGSRSRPWTLEMLEDVAEWYQLNGVRLSRAKATAFVNTVKKRWAALNVAAADFASNGGSPTRANRKLRMVDTSHTGTTTSLKSHVPNKPKSVTTVLRMTFTMLDLHQQGFLVIDTLMDNLEAIAQRQPLTLLHYFAKDVVIPILFKAEAFNEVDFPTMSQLVLRSMKGGAVASGRPAESYKLTYPRLAEEAEHVNLDGLTQQPFVTALDYASLVARSSSVTAAF